MTGGDAVLRFARGVRLRHDATRDQWVVLAPEKAFLPDGPALAVLQLVDGVRSLGAIVDSLAALFGAPRTVIEADVAELVGDLVGRGVLQA